jgi:hypothetical protein
MMRVAASEASTEICMVRSAAALLEWETVSDKQMTTAKKAGFRRSSRIFFILGT